MADTDLSIHQADQYDRDDSVQCGVCKRYVLGVEWLRRPERERICWQCQRQRRVVDRIEPLGLPGGFIVRTRAADDDGAFSGKE